MAGASVFVQRVAHAILSPPSRSHLRPFAVESVWLLPLLLALGLAGGLMHWQPRFDMDLLGLALLALVAPAFGEELLFRAALLPAPDRSRPLPCGPLLVSVALFVLWHPLQALVFGPHWRETVLDPWFLASVAAFGVASARLYWNTGSLWTSVALHWIVVVAWKAMLGGPSPWTVV